MSARRRQSGPRESRGTEPFVTHDPRFAADAMVGRLARYLRFLGYDTAYRPDVDDAELVRRAREETRIVLTRDRALVRERKASPALVLQSESALGQLREVVERWGLDWR